MAARTHERLIPGGSFEATMKTTSGMSARSCMVSEVGDIGGFWSGVSDVRGSFGLDADERIKMANSRGD